MPDQLVPGFASIPAGTFVMGADAGAPDERPAHKVYLSAFAIGVQPVTNGEYARFVHETGYRAPAVDDLPLVVIAGGEEREQAFRGASEPYVWTGSQPPAGRLDHPVTLVRWDDAAAYCRWLAKVIGKTVRLPNESEWEKAARGGLDCQKFPWGDQLEPGFANYLHDPAAKNSRGTSTCGSYPPNGYGLFDMVGNVWEWVHDWYDAGYYAVSADRNPAGPGAGQFRIVRGGGWLTAEPAMLTCSHRHHVPPDTYSYGIGFRVAYSEPDA